MTSRHSIARPVWISLAALGLAAACLAAAFFTNRGGGTSRSDRRPDVAELMRQTKAAAERNDLDAAERLVAEVLRVEPHQFEALLYKGQIARERGQPDEAVALWRQVPDGAGRFAATARYLEGTVRLAARHARDAESLFRRAAALNPTYLAPFQRLLELHVAQMRGDDVRADLAAIGSLRPLTIDEMALEVIADDQILETDEGLAAARGFVDADPDDGASRLALGRYLMAADRPVEAAAVINVAVAARPDDERARATLAEVRLDAGDVAGANDLFKERRPNESSPAPVWFTFGRAEEAAGNLGVAADAYAAAVRLRPDDNQARYRLGMCLERLGRRDEARAQLDRAKLLDELKAEAARVPRGHRERKDLLAGLLANVGDVLLRLGRPTDAERWFERALETDPSNAAAGQGLQTARTASSAPTDDALPDRPLATASIPNNSRPDANVKTVPGRAIRLSDQHADAKLDFSYFNGATGRKYLVETVGGGVAVLDYDGDGLPDLYFCQGSDLPHSPANHDHCDRLFRNKGDGTYEDATDRVGLAEYGYSLGCAAADYDNDGDTDLYVTNHGRDTLFVNNGDGTFRDATVAAGFGGEDAMSASAAFADFDRDGDLDLYVTTYVNSLLVCRSADERFSTCDPRNHRGAPDLLFLNAGDGTFEDVSASSGVAAAPDGKGLGVVAADLDDDGRTDVYVANDTTANFLFFNRTDPGGPVRLDEQGLASGTALSGDGVAQAGMGIACADFDGDGRLDLHVTNFYRECNTLYRNLGGRLFEDATRAAGLYAPTLPWLGFGTQAVDFDLNGTPDLFVANGHIDDFETRGQPWKMPAQVFRNDGTARFTEVSEPAGPYFAERCLGRGVARLDWNRDGLPDLVVVHQDRPAALLTNTSPDHGRFVRVRLRGVWSNRDATGARLRVTAGGRTQMIELCGGDGIMCSNDREQIIGLGSADRIDRIEVTWPSGRSATAEDIASGVTILWAEGRKPIVWSEASGRRR